MTRVVVCGTGFGRIYLKGVRRSGMELAGVLATGSARSVEVARRYDVPLYTSVADLPSDVDIACVVVRSGLLGGQGTALAEELLARGVHVLQEQPVHADEVAGCLRAARRAGVLYRVNAFHPHLPVVQRFLAAARTLASLREVSFVDAACAVSVSYPLVDLLGRALGGLRPWSFTASAGSPFSVVTGTIGGVPLTARVQNQLHPDDPDNHAHLLHRMAIGTDGGVLTLADTHGPVLWTPRLHVPRVDGDLVLDGDAIGADGDLASTTVLAPAPATFAELLDREWPDAVAHALTELTAQIGRPGAESRRVEQYQLSVCTAWADLTRELGPPEVVRPAPPKPLPANELEIA
ncbi:thiazolinyl imide reductase [Herbihabitans rhizosphaerae]|uniref:Thiazolinyl imide reductase n=1 Tax=Herbihabitans rhizosphaerae TaxID=1872711 RepID=A0A4Q7L9B1_9PSEU|nr:Gfo/Idh/MocA family oxidoreductase [Herbihabitans rhizosphaerae]RZS45022.1 thiazolinyl imide reductase [Herbihabitans rhizosphaerae]